jgi:CheY-like chemotaxis protein
MAHILVADDEPQIRQLVERWLLEAGHRVTLAADGREALAQIAADRPDALFTDVMMPRLDGFEVLNRLRQDPATRDLPVTMFVARSAKEDPVLMLWEHDIDALTKPFTRAEVLGRLDWVLRTGRLPPRVVVADDEWEICRSLAGALRERGIRAARAHDGVDALEAVAKYHPDLVVLDVMMPRMDGFQVLEQLRTDPHTSTIPVVMLVPQAADGAGFRGWEGGPEHSLLKPVAPAELVRLALRILQGD